MNKIDFNLCWLSRDAKMPHRTKQNSNTFYDDTPSLSVISLEFRTYYGILSWLFSIQGVSTAFQLPRDWQQPIISSPRLQCPSLLALSPSPSLRSESFSWGLVKTLLLSWACPYSCPWWRSHTHLMNKVKHCFYKAFQNNRKMTWCNKNT